MAFEKKEAYREKTSLGASDIEDEIPLIPEKFTDKFKELKEYNRQVTSFWDSVKTSFVRLEERITDLENP